MRDIVDNYRRLVGEFLTSDTLDFGLEQAARRVSSAAYRLGRRILPKSQPVEIPEQVGDPSELWDLIQRDIIANQHAAYAHYLDDIMGRMVTSHEAWVVKESPLVKRAEEKREQHASMWEEVARVAQASFVDWQEPVTADQAARAEAVAKVREQFAEAPKWALEPDLRFAPFADGRVIGTLHGVEIREHPDGTNRL